MIRPGAMRGKMLWFNEEKGHGFISTEQDERLYVDASGFLEGHPEGPCAGLVVEFQVAAGPDGRRAESVRLVEDVAPRRARRRGSR